MQGTYMCLFFFCFLLFTDSVMQKEMSLLEWSLLRGGVEERASSRRQLQGA